MSVSHAGCLDVSSMEGVSVSELHSHCLLELGLGWGAAALHLPALLGTGARRAWEALLSPEELCVGAGQLLSPCFAARGAAVWEWEPDWRARKQVWLQIRC